MTVQCLQETGQQLSLPIKFEIKCLILSKSSKIKFVITKQKIKLNMNWIDINPFKFKLETKQIRRNQNLFKKKKKR